MENHHLILTTPQAASPLLRNSRFETGAGARLCRARLQRGVRVPEVLDLFPRCWLCRASICLSHSNNQILWVLNRNSANIHPLVKSTFGIVGTQYSTSHNNVRERGDIPFPSIMGVQFEVPHRKAAFPHAAVPSGGQSKELFRTCLHPGTYCRTHRPRGNSSNRGNQTVTLPALGTFLKIGESPLPL